MEREQDADNVTRDVLIAVRRTFITPFDRGDIQDLITSMDNTIDQMQKTAKAVMLFNIRSFTPQMKEMGDAIVKCAVLVEEAVPLLRSISKEAGRISALTEQITQIEGRADDLHDVGLKELFETQGAANPMAFITGNEVYDHLEKVVDRFDDVANELQSVVIDHV
jgi:predicted phosphate transport protein (TIGR00153 family)